MVLRNNSAEVIPLGKEAYDPNEQAPEEARKDHGVLLVDDSKPKSASKTKCAVVALCYMGCAVCLIVFNKIALTGYKFPYPNVVILLQLLCSTSILAVCTNWEIVSLTDEQILPVGLLSKQSRFISWRLIYTGLPISLTFLLYMILSMYSIRGVNLAMYTTLRRTTVVFTMTIEYLTSGKLHPASIMAAVGLMVGGAMVAGLNDLAFDAYGYGMVFASNAATALYLNTIARIGKKTPLNSFGMMWCNGIVCTPILFVTCVVNGELTGALAFEYINDPAFMLILLSSCALAFALNYTIFLNTSINSALTQNVCGNLKDGVVMGFGYVSTIEEVTLDLYNLLGILMGLGGSILYAYVKLKSMR